MFNIGIIGCGKVAQVRHIPEYAAHPAARLTGCYDLDQEQTQTLAAQQDDRTYPIWEALLAGPTTDAVSICTVNAVHAKLTIATPRAGKHVLCERPMATTLTDCKVMAVTVREGDKFLMVGQNQRSTKTRQEARQLMTGGALRDILTFRITFGRGDPKTWSVDPGKNIWFFDRSKAAMGAMTNLGIHKTGLIQYLLNQAVMEATARMAILDKRGVDGQLVDVGDNTIRICHTSGGAIGTAVASWTYYGAEDNSTVLYGTEGILRIYDDLAYSLKLIAADGEEMLHEPETIQIDDNQTASNAIDRFVDYLTSNMPPAILGESVFTAMWVMFTYLESFQTGKTVSIAQD